MDNLGTNFYERIQFLIQLKKVKKIQFYTDCEILKANISRWKKGSEPSLSSLFKIVKYFNVNPEFLVNGKRNISNDLSSPDKIVKRIKNILRDITDQSDDSIKLYSPIRDLCPAYPYELQTSTDKVKYLLQTWEYGIQTPLPEELIFISNKLHCSLEFLYTGRENPEKFNPIEKNISLKRLVNNFLCLSEQQQLFVNEITYALEEKNIYHEELRRKEIDRDKSFISDMDPADPNVKSGFRFPDEWDENS